MLNTEYEKFHYTYSTYFIFRIMRGFLIFGKFTPKFEKLFFPGKIWVLFF